MPNSGYPFAAKVGQIKPPNWANSEYRKQEDYEPYEMVYFKLFESQLPVVERALYIASRMVGTERSRGYCLV